MPLEWQPRLLEEASIHYCFVRNPKVIISTSPNIQSTEALRPSPLLCRRGTPYRETPHAGDKRGRTALGDSKSINTPRTGRPKG